MDLKTHFEDGQYHFSYIFRQLIYQKFPELFEKLDFENDDHFLEPLLFGYFNGLKGMPIEQILGGYVQDQMNQVMTDEFGVAFVPKLGYFVSNTPNASVPAKKARFSEPIVLSDHNNIEVCLHTNPYYTYFMEANGADKNDACIRTIPQQAQKYIASINEAFELIQQFCPEEYSFYTHSTKRIILYEKTGMRSFVTRQVHGTVFFSIDEDSNTGFFVEELIHQCSHNVFNAITADTKEYLKIAPTIPLAKLNGEDQSREVRDIFGAYHGVYTVSTGVNSILPMVLSDQINEDLKLELLGRLAIKKPRFRTGIEQVNFDEVFTDKGMALYNYLDKRCYEQIKKYPEIFNVYSFSNQGPVFSFKRFMELNFNKILS